MALIKCKECGNVVSDKAATCPHCGSPVSDEATQDQGNGASHFDKQKSHSQKWLYTVIAALAILLLGCGAYIFLNKDKDAANDHPKPEVTGTTTGGENPMSEVTETKNEEEPATVEEGDARKEEEMADVAPSKQVEKTTNEGQAQKGGINVTLVGWISTIENVKMVLRGKSGTLSYVMDGKRIVSNIVLDDNASQIDKDGFGHLVLKSFTPNGKLKGRFIGEMDVAECGYHYEGRFVNVNGGSTAFLLTEL